MFFLLTLALGSPPEHGSGPAHDDVELLRDDARTQLEIGEPEVALETLMTAYASIGDDDPGLKTEVGVEVAKARLEVFHVTGDGSQLARAESLLEAQLQAMEAEDSQRREVEVILEEVRAAGDEQDAARSDSEPAVVAPATGSANPPESEALAPDPKLQRKIDNLRKTQRTRIIGGAVGMAIFVPTGIVGVFVLRGGVAMQKAGRDSGDESLEERGSKRVSMGAILTAAGFGMAGWSTYMLASSGKFGRRAAALEAEQAGKTAWVRPLVSPTGFGLEGAF